MASQISPAQQACIRAQLARILSSVRFRDSARMSAFLTFVVEKTLSGAEAEVKESLIGIEVYNRSADFDPQTDSIVRVEASRLRSKLRDYYLEEGAAEQWRIELPKGTYVPVFRRIAGEDGGAASPLEPVLPPDQPKPEAPVQPHARRRRWPIWTAFAAIALAVALWQASRPVSPVGPGPVRRVAVLPFADLTESGDLDYFCEGLAEEVIDSLSRLEGLAVLARGSSFKFRGPEFDFLDIGRQLDVDRLLVGSVRRSGTVYRVSARLVDAKTGVALWSSQFDREAGNELRVQEDISREVARALELSLTPRRERAQSRAGAEAHNLYLRGRYYYWKSTAEDERRARQFFEEAIALAPDFAAAHAGLADTVASMPLRGLKVDEALLDQARAASERAYALDPQLLDSLLAKAHLARNIDYDWGEAERLYRRAVSLHPGAARPHNSYGVLLSLMDRLEDADRELREALRLDPLSMQVHTNLTLNLYRQGRHADAVEQADKAAAIDPNYRNIYSPKAAALGALGRPDEALRTLEVLRDRSGGELTDNHLALKGHILARAGRIAAARQVLSELEKRGAARYVPRAAFADVFLGLGENDRALQMMEQALLNREVLLAGLFVSPHSRAIRNDPRFRQLRERLARR